MHNRVIQSKDLESVPTMKPYQKLLYIITATFVSMSFLGVMLGTGAYYYLEPGLPGVDTLKEVKLEEPLRIYSRDGKLIEQIGAKRRIPVTYEEIPEKMIEAILAAEDDRFFSHPGVDYQGLIRAVIFLALTGERRQGGGTITMQLARNFFLTRERTYVRKAREILLALRIEHELSKKEILTLYLNKIFLGQRAYGVGAAAEVYFGKHISELSLPEIATIAGLPKAPSNDNPVSNPDRARGRRAYVLRRMLEVGSIDQQQHDRANIVPMMSHLHGPAVETQAAYVAEMVRIQALQILGSEAYTDGYRVTTTIDSRLQDAANRALRQALLEYDARHGYRGALARFDLDTGVQIPLGDDGQPLAPTVQTQLQTIIGEDNGIENEAVMDTASGQETDESSQDDHVARWGAILKAYPSPGGLTNALVIDVAEKNALVYTVQHGEIELTWKALSWARPYISESRKGQKPTMASEVVTIGDVIRIGYLVEDYWRLMQEPEVQGALVAVDPQDGALVALGGGFDYATSKYNRAVQAKRQPGSSFKPFIYSAALDSGFTAASVFLDSPVVIEDAGLETTWRPVNYSGQFYGPTRLREALVRSRNLVSIRILQAIGLGNSLRHLDDFGFPREALPRDLSLALGSAALTPLQMATAYTAFANGGFMTESYFIDRIENSAGEAVYQADPLLACWECEKAMLRIEQMKLDNAEVMQPATNEVADPSIAEDPYLYLDVTPLAPRAVEAQNAWLIADMMRDVIRRGTGRRARALGRSDLSGKTGTTNEGLDTWFSGFNADLVATAWVGFDQLRPLGPGEEGSRTALPMWIYFMREALDGVPEHTLDEPPGLVTVRINPSTGKLQPTGVPGAIFEIFAAGTEPKSSIEDIIDPFNDAGEEIEEEELF